MLNLSRIQVVLAFVAFLFLIFLPNSVLAAETEFDQAFAAGIKALQKGNLTQAEKLLKDSLKMEDKQGGTESKRDQSKLVLANFYKSQKRFPEAEGLYNQLLAKFEKSQTGDQLVVVMSGLGGLYKAQGKVEDALALYKKVLDIVNKQDGPDSASAGTAHANLGLIYKQMNKDKEAEQEQLVAIKLLEAKNNPQAAECMCDLAGQYMFEHKTKQAIEMLEKALAIVAKAAPDSVIYANCAEQLGSAYVAEGRYANAEELSRAALKIYQKASGPESIDVAICLTNMAGRLAKQGKNQEALQTYRKSNEYEEKASPQFIDGILNNLHGMAEIYVEQTDYKKSEAVLRKALELGEKKWGAKHESLVPCLKSLANCLIIEGVTGEEPDILNTRADEIMTQFPLSKRKQMNDYVKHEMVKGLDINSKESKKKNSIW